MVWLLILGHLILNFEKKPKLILYSELTFICVAKKQKLLRIEDKNGTKIPARTKNQLGPILELAPKPMLSKFEFWDLKK